MPTLNWLGKDKVINHHLHVPFHFLDKKFSVGNSDNKIIHGDNLLALKSLLPRYQNKIKCIYIDPPYNTGNENWVYNDNVSDSRLQKWIGQVVGSEDLTRHDKWLCMMYPRLRLLQKLLSNDGAIFISIDDNEQAALKFVCDEIFGASNFVANIIWKKKTNGNNMGIIPPVHDFIMVYCKNINQLTPFTLPLSEEYLKGKYSNPDNDPRGAWTTTDLSANHKGPYFEITNPKTGEKFFPPQGRFWVFNEAEVLRRIADGRIIFGKTGNSRPVQKVFANERDLTIKPDTWFDKQGYNSDATKMLANIIGSKIFEFPKPVELIEYILKFATDKNSIVLDSFAGSGTTAHAVTNLNKSDGGNRKFILVELNDYAESITAERVKRIGGEFDFYEVGESLFNEDKLLNSNLPFKKICEYIYFSETGKEFIPCEEKNLLGVDDDTAYYFFSGENLSWTTLSKIKTRAKVYVIYAEACNLSEAELMKYHIYFRRIPFDIRRY